MKWLKMLIILFLLTIISVNAWATTYEWEHQSKSMISMGMVGVNLIQYKKER